MQKKHLFIPLIALTLIIAPVSAASPSPSQASDKDITENLKKKIIENIGKEEDKPASSTVRAYIGVVKDVIKDTIIIEDKDGKKDIKLETDTTILRSPGNASIKPENIRIGDYIIAIGYPQDEEMLTGRRLIVSIEPIKTPSKTSGLGTISKIGKSSLTLKLQDKEQTLDLTSKTIYKSAVGTIELADLSIGDTLIYTASMDADDDQTATVIMRTGTASISE